MAEARDRRYEISPESYEIMSHIWESVGHVCEEMRKEDSAAILACLPVLFSWMTALWNNLGINIKEAAWFKYPGVCPYCLSKDLCSCIIMELKYNSNESSLDELRRIAANNPRDAVGWQAMLAKIYGRVNKINSTHAVWFHLIEEIGEVSRELRLQNYERLREENADMFAWFLSFCTKLRISIKDIGEV